MSVEIINNFDQNSIPYESVEDLDFMEKCGDIYLERKQGNLYFVCNFCDYRFGNGAEFSKHITEVHISIENYIAYEPSESEVDVDINVKDIDPIEKRIQEPNNEELSDYETLIKIEDNFSEEEVFESVVTKEKQMFDLEEETIENQCPEETLKEDENIPEPFEITVISEKLTIPENKFFQEEEPPEPTDEEILRSKLTCKFCNEQFEFVKTLRQHDCGSNKRRKKYLCSICGKEFKKKSGLDTHSLLHKGEKPHKCDTCGAAYACKQNLIVHVRRHTGEKPFKCDYCDKCFASSTERISHVRTHTGDRPYVCELCGKGHTSSSQLTEHMNRHLDIRNYICEICSKAFRNSYNLRMHRQTHDKGPRKFQCEQCESSFKTQNSLAQHLKIHEKVKKYVCKVCGKAFAQHPGLYNHMKSHCIVSSE